MVIRKLRGRRRWGATTIETALVMIPTIMFLMGVFEYGRLLMDWNVLNNASREGCRYALVNNTSPTIGTEVQAIVNAKMGRELSSFTNFTVTVSGYHLGVYVPPANVNTLAAGDLITVTVSGKYIFVNVFPFAVTPSLTITSSVTMVCEGAT
jgi:Flp pilus assembly protein TadG